MGETIFLNSSNVDTQVEAISIIEMINMADSNDTLDRTTTNFARLLVEGAGDRISLRRIMIIDVRGGKIATAVMMDTEMNITLQEGGMGESEEGAVDEVTMTTT